MNKKYKLLGINDEDDTCTCCGKTHLMQVMWLAEIDADGNEISESFPYGTTCGSKLLRAAYGKRAAENMTAAVESWSNATAKLDRLIADGYEPVKIVGWWNRLIGHAEIRNHGVARFVRGDFEKFVRFEK